jgi:hypothetical protein
LCSRELTHSPTASATSSGRPTPRDAEKLLAKLQNEVNERRYSQASITLARAIDQWLEVARHKASARERYYELIRFYLTTVLGKCQLVEVDPQTLERLYSRLQDCRRLSDPKSRTCGPCEPLASNTVRDPLHCRRSDGPSRPLPPDLRQQRRVG